MLAEEFEGKAFALLGQDDGQPAINPDPKKETVKNELSLS